MNQSYILREVTPEPLRCLGIGCPTIYAVERTPEPLRCFGGIGCPGVFEGLEHTYLIVGKQIDLEQARTFQIGEGKTLADKIGLGEVLISLPKGIIDGMERKQ